MAVTVNGKIIRSLPEQVCENTKKIKEIEGQKSLYLYVAVFLAQDGSCASFQFVANKGDYEYEDDFDAMIAALKDNKTTVLPASGFSYTENLPIHTISVTASDELQLEVFNGNVDVFDSTDMDGIYCKSVKIL